MIAPSPRALTIESSFKAVPLGFFSPRSHSLTAFGRTFNNRANTLTHARAFTQRKDLLAGQRLDRRQA